MVIGIARHRERADAGAGTVRPWRAVRSRFVPVDCHVTHRWGGRRGRPPASRGGSRNGVLRVGGPVLTCVAAWLASSRTDDLADHRSQVEPAPSRPRLPGRPKVPALSRLMHRSTDPDSARSRRGDTGRPRRPVRCAALAPEDSTGSCVSVIRLGSVRGFAGLANFGRYPTSLGYVEAVLAGPVPDGLCLLGGYCSAGEMCAHHPLGAGRASMNRSSLFRSLAAFSGRGRSRTGACRY